MINVDLSDKQLEIRARGAQILRIGFDLLEAGGLENVRLDSIAEQLGCTRSTIYNHYKNREEVLVAMAASAVQRRLSLFEFGVAEADSSREKILAICLASMVYVDELPLDFSIEQAIRHEAIWQNTTEERRELFSENELACMRLAGNVVNDAVVGREVPLPEGLSVDQMIERVCFGLWSMSFGGLAIEASSPSLQAVGIRDVRSTIHHNCNALLDSFDWKPLFDPIAYQSFLKRLTPKLVQKDKDLLPSNDSFADTTPTSS